MIHVGFSSSWTWLVLKSFKNGPCPTTRRDELMKESAVTGAQTFWREKTREGELMQHTSDKKRRKLPACDATVFCMLRRCHANINGSIKAAYGTDIMLHFAKLRLFSIDFYRCISNTSDTGACGRYLYFDYIGE